MAVKIGPTRAPNFTHFYLITQVVAFVFVFVQVFVVPTESVPVSADGIKVISRNPNELPGHGSGHEFRDFDIDSKLALKLEKVFSAGKTPNGNNTRTLKAVAEAKAELGKAIQRNFIKILKSAIQIQENSTNSSNSVSGNNGKNVSIPEENQNFRTQQEEEQKSIQILLDLAEKNKLDFSPVVEALPALLRQNHTSETRFTAVLSHIRKARNDDDDDDSDEDTDGDESQSRPNTESSATSPPARVVTTARSVTAAPAVQRQTTPPAVVTVIFVQDPIPTESPQANPPISPVKVQPILPAAPVATAPPPPPPAPAPTPLIIYVPQPAAPAAAAAPASTPSRSPSSSYVGTLLNIASKVSLKNVSSFLKGVPDIFEGIQGIVESIEDIFS